MLFRTKESSPGERGQVLVIVAAGLTVLIAFVGLIIDGGNAWGQQRSMQNGTDAAAEAGAVVLAQRIGGAPRTDADIAAAIENSRLENNIQVPRAYYTDYLGRMLTVSGTLAPTAASAARVGGGTIPPLTQGVRALGRRTFETFIARIVGSSQWTTSGEATAVAGPPTTVCAAADGCGLLPITFPVNRIQCNGENRVEYMNPIQEYQAGQRYVFPLCKQDPGNVGWLDWVPPYGGASELADAALNPTNQAIQLPSWQGIGQTGTVSSAPLEDALRTWVGKQARILMFDGTCDILPAGSTLDACPAGNIGGTGSNQHYHIPRLMTLTIEAVYTNGNADDPTEPGAAPCAPLGKRCIIGTITAFTYTGTVGQISGLAPIPDVVIQLIK